MDPAHLEHMLNYFIKYMHLHGDKAPMHALVCAYRGTFKLTKKEFWLDKSFFDFYPNVFKTTSTAKGTLVELATLK